MVLRACRVHSRGNHQFQFRPHLRHANSGGQRHSDDHGDRPIRPDGSGHVHIHHGLSNAGNRRRGFGLGLWRGQRNHVNGPQGELDDKRQYADLCNHRDSLANGAFGFLGRGNDGHANGYYGGCDLYTARDG